MTESTSASYTSSSLVRGAGICIGHAMSVEPCPACCERLCIVQASFAMFQNRDREPTPQRAMSAAAGTQIFLQGSDVECRQDQSADEVSPSLVGGTGVSAVPLLGAAGVFDKTVKAMSSTWMDTFVWPTGWAQRSSKSG